MLQRKVSINPLSLIDRAHNPRYFTTLHEGVDSVMRVQRVNKRFYQIKFLIIQKNTR